jgi:hypothetical protein
VKDFTLLGVHAEHGIDAFGAPFFYMKRFPAELYVYAKRPGVLKMNARFDVGSDHAGTTYRTLDIRTPAGYQHTQNLADGDGFLTVPVNPGVNQITLTVQDPDGSGAADPYLLGVHDFMLILYCQQAKR